VINGKPKRKWIAAKPVNNRPDRAKQQFEKIQKKVFRSKSLDIPILLEPETYQSKNNISINLLEVVSLMDIRKRTSDSYKSDIRILHKLFPSLDFTSKSLKLALQAKYPNGKTARNKFGAIKTVFNYAQTEKLISFNPFDEKVNAPKAKGDSNSNFPFNDFERSKMEPELMKYPELYLFTRFIYYSFSRPKELLALRVGDINLKTKTIRIKPENAKTELLLIKPIVKPFMELLVNSGIMNNPNSYYVFGKGLKPGLVQCPINFPAQEHQKILTKLGLYRPYETVPYSWKHTGNINAYLAGMDLKLIQKINGHTSILTTEIYLRKLGLFLDKQAFDFSF
jgi:integrase